MASVNKVILVGNLGNDPDVRPMQNGDSVTTISVATTDKWKDKTTGGARENTEWHRVAFFGKLAEVASQYLKKGSAVYIEGSIRTRKYVDKDGVEKSVTDIRANSMQMLGGKSYGEDEPNTAQEVKWQPKPRERTIVEGGLDDDIPF